MACHTIAEARLCLASASPRRAELLEQIGVAFTRLATDIDEQAVGGDIPRQRALDIARQKAQAAHARESSLPILAADTVVVCEEAELGKPVDREDAARMLMRLSGRSHWVYTAVVVHAGERIFEDIGATEVWFRELSERDIARYCATDEPYDKAGAYGIQGRAAVFISRIEGSYSNVVGLPLFETAVLLEKAGIWP